MNKKRQKNESPSGHSLFWELFIHILITLWKNNQIGERSGKN